MSGYDAIVNPAVGKHAPPVGPVAVMAACEPDLKALSQLLGYRPENRTRLLISRLYSDPQKLGMPALSGPMIGAPYAAMVLESLIIRGARRILFIGWCGALVPDLQIGDLILPGAALVGEGTSPNYPPAAPRTFPSADIMRDAQNVLAAEDIQVRQGTIWTTDAAFRETRDQVKFYRARGADAVDMETSALFAVAAFRRVKLAAVLVVSDSLAGESWQPGFRSPRFRSGRKAAHYLVNTLCRKLHPPK
jgi:nucleoside phosphorylase